MKSEAEITNECITWARSKGWICRRKQVGVFYTRNATPIKIGKNGEADWEVLKVLSKGVVLFAEVEFKAPKGSQSKEQMEYQAMAESKGITYLLIRCLDDMRMELQSMDEMGKEIV
jgi:hypothetical protein